MRRAFGLGVTFFEKAAVAVVLMPLALSFVLVLWA